MSITYCEIASSFHRLIPSRFPPILLFDWATSPQELEEIAALEGLTNDRLQSEYGNISLVVAEDWVSGPGATPLMAAFTHPGYSRFSDGSYGVYYAGECLKTAIEETRFHRTRFLAASMEAPCLLQMREYTVKVIQKLIDLHHSDYQELFHPDPSQYSVSQSFARTLRNQKEWGLYYPSVRNKAGKCVAIFRPPALTIPMQGRHLDYIWDGKEISEVRVSQPITV